MSELTHFDKRKIQMEYVVPLVKDLQEVLGETEMLEALEQVGRLRLERASKKAEIEISQVEPMLGMYAAGDSLRYDVIASSSEGFDFNVTHCRYAEMMEELGGREFGHLLICNGDFVGAREFGLELKRTQTRMEGAQHCDFRYQSGATD